MAAMFIIVCFTAHLQSPVDPFVSGYPGMEAYSSSLADVFSILTNTASLAQLKSSSAGLVSERRFLMDELNTCAALLGVVVPRGRFALKILYAGFSECKQTQAGLAYARRLGQYVDAGVQFSYHGFQITGYGGAAELSVEAAVVFHVTEKLNAGISIFNPGNLKFGPGSEERLPALYKLGMGYEASPIAFVSAEIIKEEFRPVDAKIGIRYRVHPLLFVKAGVSTATSSIWTGAGIVRRSLHLDMAISYHPVLGVSPQLSLQFVSKEKRSLEKAPVE